MLMCCASFRRSPVASDRDKRSLPARSTRYKTPRVIVPVSLVTPSTCTMTMLCDREERSFIAVAPVARFTSPSNITSATSRLDVTVRVTAVGTLNPAFFVGKISTL